MPYKHAYKVIRMRRQASLDRQNFELRRNLLKFFHKLSEMSNAVSPYFFLFDEIVENKFGNTYKCGWKLINVENAHIQ